MDNIEKPLITKEGLEQLKKELHQRESIKKKDLVDTLIISKESGDERENDGFSLAFEDFKINEQRILDLKEVIKYHEVIEPKQNKKVELGHTIRLEDQEGNKKEFQLVGDLEVDPIRGKISIKSPVGNALLGLNLGESIKIGRVDYKIESIIY